MASEWARKRAGQLSACKKRWAVEQFAEALDEAWAAGRLEGRVEGAQRERWECHSAVSDISDRFGGTAGAAAIRVAERGPMRGPEEEEK